eukprot:2238688-Prymnesium_polylepis.1
MQPYESAPNVELWGGNARGLHESRKRDARAKPAATASAACARILASSIFSSSDTNAPSVCFAFNSLWHPFRSGRSRQGRIRGINSLALSPPPLGERGCGTDCKGRGWEPDARTLGKLECSTHARGAGCEPTHAPARWTGSASRPFASRTASPAAATGPRPSDQRRAPAAAATAAAEAAAAVAASSASTPRRRARRPRGARRQPRRRASGLPSGASLHRAAPRRLCCGKLLVCNRRSLRLSCTRPALGLCVSGPCDATASAGAPGAGRVAGSRRPLRLHAPVSYTHLRAHETLMNL